MSPGPGLASGLRLSAASLLGERSKTISSLGRNSYYRVPAVQAQTCKLAKDTHDFLVIVHSNREFLVFV